MSDDAETRSTDFVPTPIERLNTALSGQYEIEDELGEGGMAVVYRARDVRHDRQVAVKVLKPSLAQVIGSERFLSEIKTTASLQHPNILPLFDSGEADGFLFYVMPYVKGVTLQQRIDSEKQLPIDEAVRMIVEIADGLDHAHRQGVIHRDIKPANILIRDGRPVIMDFGIAIAVGAAGSQRLTETGLSLGTPFYMSPEQATGDRDIGPATDIYSLSAVLYEALTGDPPFMGGTAQAVLGKIVASDTVSVRTSRRTIPTNVDHAIQKGLAKLPADRFETTGAFAGALRDPSFHYTAAWDPLTGAAAGASVHRETSAASAPWWNPVTIAMSVLTVMLSLALAFNLSGDAPGVSTDTVHFTLLPRGVGAQFVGADFPGISQDGRLLAFPARVGDTTRIQLRDLDGFSARWVEGTEGGFSPFFSPDGQWLGFFTVDEIRKVPISGGQPTSLASVPFLMEAFAVWLPNDTIVFHHQSSPGLVGVHANGSDVWTVTTPDRDRGEIRHAVPRTLPDGRILFQVRRSESIRDQWTDGHSGGIVSLETGDIVRLETPGAPWAYLPGDDLLVWHSGAFRAYPFDLGRSEATGPASVVRTDLRGGDSCDFLRVSNSGTAVCADQSANNERTLAWFDREGETEKLAFPPADYRWPRVSPDGRSIAGFAANRLSVIDTRTNAVVEIAGSLAGEPTWTSDGRALVFWSQPALGTTHLWIRDRLAAEPPRQLTDDPGQRHWPTSVSPDGSTVLFYDQRDLWTVPVEGGEPSPLMALPDSWQRDGQYSPDGTLIAYSSDELGGWEVFVMAADAIGGRTRISMDGGRGPQWAPDGRELYFVQGRQMMAVSVDREPRLTIGTPRRLFQGGFWVDPSGDQFYDVAPDGRLLMIEGDDVVDLRVVTGLAGGIEGPSGR
jgi:serine/threonine-protein kinase